jgi:hypothetical protein
MRRRLLPTSPRAPSAPEPPRGLLFAVASAVLASFAAGACADSGDELGDGPTAAASGPQGSSSTAGGPSGSGPTGSGGTSGSSGPSGSSGSSGPGGGGEGGADPTGNGGAGNGGGPVDDATLLFVAGGGDDLFAGELYPQQGWDTATLAEATSFAPGVALLGADEGLAVVRGDAGGALRWASWSPGSWSAFAAVGPAITAQAGPALAGAPGAAHATFHGDNFKHYYGSFAASWSPDDEAIGSPQSFGPSPASIVVDGADVIVAYAGDNGDVYLQTRSGGVWGAGVGLSLGNVASSRPALATLSGGMDLMVVFARKSDAQLVWTAKSGNSWTVAAEIEQGFATAPPALLGLPNGDAVVAYRGLNGGVYTAYFDASASPPWSVPSPLASPNFVTPSAPALAAGIGGKDAELLFIDDASGAVTHSRLVNTSWSAPAAVGGIDLTHVAAASWP